MQIDSKAVIGENVEIGFGTIIYGNVEIGANTVIGPYSIIGERVAEAYSNKEYNSKKTYIGENSIIRSHSIIYEDVEIGENFQSGHRITIREKTIIGKNCSVGTLCDLQGDLQIGDFVRLHSNVHIGQKSRIEDFVWIYPYVVLTNDPYPPMGELKGVTIKQYAQVATASVILPGITIGENSLIGAYSLVRKDVQPERVIVGVPGKDLCSVREILNDKKERVYPWKEYLKDFRGYPWQIKKDFENN
ncbi:hypothetical protein RGU12_21040 [Fredinandcohnia sp. QZ13]|uniref:N-acetyltransferase n=1 Tax=Fredinandcohnia sp. QZ13 TaxID=3073144 RepID=UPI002853084C|nr:hypothetical protein [Fredinandcohnia sp. QZ13]MDR4889986.1 hypothetical protein [Fredinandcohnia sp. QZ13]